MPPPREIPAFDPRFFRPCTFAMLRELGYETRVTLNNGIESGPSATEMAVSLSVWDDGAHLGTTPELLRLAPGGIVKLKIDDLVREHFPAASSGDLLAMLHAVPAAWVGEEAVDVPAAEMMAHGRVSDDFVEYHQRPHGIITGVAYQTGPLNDPRLSSTRTTVCQAPKVIVSEPVDTLFLLMNVSSTGFGYSHPVRMDFWILGPDGERVVRSSVEVPAFGFRLVSATAVLEEAGLLERYRERGGTGMFLGLSKNGTLVPISLTRNKVSRAIACDHTLPPVFYISTWGGEARLRANARLEQAFFADAAEPAPQVIA